MRFAERLHSASGSHTNVSKAAERKFFYGWVVVGISTILITATSATLNSFGVFFRPLTSDFGWSRASTSGIQSLFLICIGVFSIVLGWLADRFGTARVLSFAGSLSGLGLILTSRISELWQIFLTYSVMTGVGFSCVFPATGNATAQWFVKRRGLVLGIVASGSGIGTLLGPPAVARIIDSSSWSRAYLILGIVAWVVIVVGALFLKRKPAQEEVYGYETPLSETRSDSPDRLKNGGLRTSTFSTAIRTKTLWILFSIFFLFSFSNQMVMVHLVNYAIDLRIAPLIAATLMSVVGLSSTAGRLFMGGASDRIGNINVLALGCLGIVPSLIWLIFAKELWMLYLFAVVYGFSYGSEVPQQTALIGQFFGLRVVLIGILQAAIGTGGALGSWLAGRIFDVTLSYQIAFFIGCASIVSALTGAIILRRRQSVKSLNA